MSQRGRTVRTRDPRRNILILGEGLSEYVYFRRLQSRFPHMRIISQNGKGGGSYDNLITTVRKSADIRGLDVDKGDVLAIVADVDEHTPDDIAEAMEACSREHIGFYISNIDFEVWLLMHFEDITRWMEKNELAERLSDHLGRPYDKGEGIAADDAMVDDAVRRGLRDIPVPEDAVGRCLAGDRSRTTVHLLVGGLSDYA